MSNLRSRIKALESNRPHIQRKDIVFFIHGDFDDSEITAFEYRELKILRVTNEAVEAFKYRASTFFFENNTEITHFARATYFKKFIEL